LGILPAVRELARELPDDPAVSELPRLVEAAAVLARRRA
jgi:hypothetical protein